jgi:calcineurin-like phosphoesterase family protein
MSIKRKEHDTMAGGNTWVLADPHFTHHNILGFKRPDGTPLRPFQTVKEMDETLISNWNGVVQDEDRVYLMGDVAFKPAYLRAIIPRLRGRIVLVKGNHDDCKLSLYHELFDDVRACVPKKGFILTHIPIHPDSLGRWGLNIHGHLHAHVVTKGPHAKADPRYVCVSVEQLDYTPKLLSKVLEEAELKRN